MTWLRQNAKRIMADVGAGLAAIGRWFRRNADRFGLIVGAGFLVTGIQQAFGKETALILTGLLLMAGSLRRKTP